MAKIKEHQRTEGGKGFWRAFCDKYTKGRYAPAYAGDHLIQRFLDWDWELDGGEPAAAEPGQWQLRLYFFSM